MAQFLIYDCTFKKQSTVPVTLTFDLWKYEFQIDISTNSWEKKYQNMGIGLLHVKRRTRQKWRSMTSDRHQIWHTDREYE